MSRFLPESDKKNFTYNTERLFSMYDIKKPIIYRVFLNFDILLMFVIVETHS